MIPATLERPLPAILHRGPDLPAIPVEVVALTTTRNWFEAPDGQWRQRTRAMARIAFGTTVGLRRLEFR